MPNPTKNFPAEAYINNVRTDPENTPGIEMVPMHKMDIGARASGLPKNMRTLHGISHVGGRQGNK